MAPRIFEFIHYTMKVDVDAYAIILWEMLFESVPFQGWNGFQVAAKRDIKAIRQGQSWELFDGWWIPGHPSSSGFLTVSGWGSSIQSRTVFSNSVPGRCGCPGHRSSFSEPVT
jgi:serine/threonine protein kinase